MTFITWLESVVRSGDLPEQPELIQTWLALTTPKPTEPVINQLNGHHRQVVRLLETISDELVPRTWRRSCVDNINRPLAALERLVVCDCNRRALAQLEHEVRQTIGYFEPSLNTPQP
ncbi:MAG: hypothetical protein AAF460_04620 [Pseudomonadota bacterium]